MPSRLSAPGWLMMVAESCREATRNDKREGKLFLMTPVITSVDGRCVANIKWMPAARAFCAKRCTDISTSRGATHIRSANSSTSTTM